MEDLVRLFPIMNIELIMKRSIHKRKRSSIQKQFDRPINTKLKIKNVFKITVVHREMVQQIQYPNIDGLVNMPTKSKSLIIKNHWCVCVTLPLAK